MYRHLVNEIYHTVVYTLLPIDYVHDSQSAARTDFDSVLVAEFYFQSTVDNGVSVKCSQIKILQYDSTL